MSVSQVYARKNDSYLVSIVLPCYNEEAVLRETHSRLIGVIGSDRSAEYEVLYVDDGSVDGTWSVIQEFVAREPSVRALRFGRNFGHQAGCLAGLREAVGDAVVLIDADLQDPPELIPEMVSLWRQGWPVVSARRSGREGESYFKKLSAFAYYRILKAMSDHPVALDTGDFRLLDRNVVDLLTGLGDNELFLRGAISWAGFPETAVEYQRGSRASGESKYTLRKMLALSRRGIISGSAAPLRAPAYLGLASLAGAGGIAVSRRDPKAALTAAMFGIQTLAIGVLGEYMRGVFRHVEDRPAYVISERTSSPVADSSPVPAVEEVA